MSETWRRKTYYKPRVLISTERVLDPQFEDALLCITGAQLEMLRNLTQYLHRRSSFVSSNHDGYYLVADNDDWDDIQAIVADLEETLMGCEEFTALFESMLAQMQCICNKASTPPGGLGTVPPIVLEYLDDGKMIDNDPYGVDTEISARRCAVAQLTFWQSYEWLTEVIQPLQDNAMDVVVPLFFSVVAVLVGVTPLAIPAGAAIAMLSALVDVWIEGSLTDVQNAIWAHRDELTCAVYMGLSYDYAAAEANAAGVLGDITELSPMDLVVMRAMFAPWAMALASNAYTQGTDWALANVSSGACDDCEWIYDAVYEWPPCPGTFSGGFSCWTGRWPGLNANEEALSPTFTIPDITGDIDIRIECRFMSKFGSGWTVGYAQVEYQDAALDWNLIGQCQVSTTEPLGAINTTITNTVDASLDRNVLRVNLHGQPGQGDNNPWPFMPVYVRVTITPSP